MDWRIIWLGAEIGDKVICGSIAVASRLRKEVSLQKRIAVDGTKTHYYTALNRRFTSGMTRWYNHVTQGDRRYKDQYW